MTRFLLDTNAVSALVNRREPIRRRAQEARSRGGRIGTTEPVISELFYGLELSTTRDENIVRMEHGLAGILCWPFNGSAARTYGRLAADLRRRGRPMQIIDMMVAAVALSLRNCVIVTTDSDLSAVPGLTVENWMSDYP
jgi:tRNA(fMet)-specific endonuclease VapC